MRTKGDTRRRRSSPCAVLFCFCWLQLVSVQAAERSRRRLYHRNSTTARFLAEDGVTEMVQVVATLCDNHGLDYHGHHFDSSFERTNAVRMAVPVSEMEELRANPEVEEVEEDPLVYPMQSSSERIPWGVDHVQGLASGIPAGTSGSGGCLKVCIIDGGARLDHVDFPYNLGNSNVRGKAFDMPQGQSWHNPNHPHGTHIAGTIFATANNNKGVIGIISNTRNICLRVARVFDDRNSPVPLSVIDEALEWCADENSHVINLSFGATIRTSNNQRIINRLVNQEGILIVSAAGNGGGTAKFFPASFSTAISVGAIDKSNKRASFSQYNSAVDLAAPGVDIVSLDTKNNGYLVMSGTSMATPHVSGVIAKIWAARRQCSNMQIREAVERSARDLGEPGKDNHYGHGLIQAKDAYDYLLSNFAPPCGNRGGGATTNAEEGPTHKRKRDGEERPDDQEKLMEDVEGERARRLRGPRRGYQ